MLAWVFPIKVYKYCDIGQYYYCRLKNKLEAPIKQIYEKIVTVQISQLICMIDHQSIPVLT